nr:hypothetical protein [Tanacetum cinerariifolium]
MLFTMRETYVDRNPKVIKPLPAAPAADSTTNVLVEWNAIYDAYNEVTCLILGSITHELHRQFENSSPYDVIQELKSMFEKQAEVERFDLIQTFHACKQEEGKPVATYVLQMKGYVDQLEHLGYMLPQDLIVGLILNGLTKDFIGFVRNYDMHNMGKTIGELHVMLIEYEMGLPKKAETPQVMMIKCEHPTKDDTCHHCKEVGHYKRNCPVYFAELLKKNNNGIYEIDMHDNVPNVNSIYNVSTKRAKHNLDSTYLWHCRLTHISKKRIEKLQQEGLLKSTDDESLDQCVSCLSGKMTRKSFPHRPERVTDLLGIIHTDLCGPLRHVSTQGASYFITFIDDYSRYSYVYLLKHKHEVFETFKEFKNKVENQLEKIIKALRSNRGGECISQEFRHGSIYDESYNSAIILLGLCSRGCEALMKRDMLDKLQQRSVKCILIGYPKETMGYYFYIPPENKIVVTRYAEFFEKNIITQEVSGTAVDLEEIQDEDTSPSEITSEIPMEVEGFEPP